MEVQSKVFCMVFLFFSPLFIMKRSQSVQMVNLAVGWICAEAERKPGIRIPAFSAQ